MRSNPRIYAYKNKVREELTFLEERDGVLKPESVIEFARNKKTELHKEFDWNDTTAAHQWRLQQARILIKTIVTILPDNKDRQVKVKAYYHFDAPENGYISMVRVMSDTELKDRMLADAKKELDEFRKKYNTLKELADVLIAIDHILNSEKVPV